LQVHFFPNSITYTGPANFCFCFLQRNPAQLTVPSVRAALARPTSKFAHDPPDPLAFLFQSLLPLAHLHPSSRSGGAKGAAERDDVGDDGGGAFLAGGGDDLHRLLQHLRRAGAKLPQGALQVRGRFPREGPLRRRQLGGRQAGEAQ
jgi:hypothetical protein